MSNLYGKNILWCFSVLWSPRHWSFSVINTSDILLEGVAVLSFAQPYDISPYHWLKIMEGLSPPMLPSFSKSTVIYVSLFLLWSYSSHTMLQLSLAVLFITSTFPFCCPFGFYNSSCLLSPFFSPHCYCCFCVEWYAFLSPQEYVSLLPFKYSLQALNLMLSALVLWCRCSTLTISS